jgi:hypothetical protein
VLVHQSLLSDDGLRYTFTQRDVVRVYGTRTVLFIVAVGRVELGRPLDVVVG